MSGNAMCAETKKNFFCWAAAVVLLWALPAPARAQVINGPDGRPWFKADLHTHHTLRDPLEDLIAKYRETGYQFLVLSNKDMHEPINFEPYSSPEMRVVNGVEQAYKTRKDLLGHVLGFPIDKPDPITGHLTVKEGYARLRQKNKRVVLCVNHPHDGKWTIDDIMEANDEGIPLFELNSIDMKHGEFETKLWDEALSRGARMYATLTNDVHSFGDIDAYGWIMIRSKSLGMKPIGEALNGGDFYAVESGCEAKPARHEIVDGPDGKTLEVSAPGAKTIRVIAQDGSIDGIYNSDTISHPIAGHERYLRVEILDANGRYIFMQPFFLKDK